ncbi:MAG: universal stress protein [Flavobacteriaceae bacterium]|nr:universal stress protein [Flavobacteriaceae bacterium]
MKNILVPTGSTENAVSNLQYAIEFASLYGATVYVINLYEELSKAGGLSKVNRLILEEHQSELDILLAKVDFKGVKVIAKPVKGEAFESISRISKQLDIDLLILSPKSVSLRDEVYLGRVTGRLIKQTEIPVLIVPQDYAFKKAKTILMAFKNGRFEKKNMLRPLKLFLEVLNSKLNLLHVIVPHNEDCENPINAKLTALSSKLTTTHNATTFQGVLEHFQSNKPDMLCVARRKRGFFNKLWEKNIILKKEFHCSIPLLILRGND